MIFVMNLLILNDIEFYFMKIGNYDFYYFNCYVILMDCKFVYFFLLKYCFYIVIFIRE